MRYDPSGGAQWARATDGAESFFYFLGTGLSGSLFAVGEMMGNGVYDLGSGVTVQGSSVYTNALLAGFDLSGKPLWVRSQTGGDGQFHFTTAAADAAHGYLAGYFYDVPSGQKFDFGNGVVAESGRWFLVSFNRSGLAEWIEMSRAGDSVWDISCMVVDRSGYLVVAGSGSLQRTLDFGHGVTLAPPRTFVAKYKLAADRL